MDVINQFYIWLKNVAKMEIGSLVNVPKDHAIWLNLAFFWIKYFLYTRMAFSKAVYPKSFRLKMFTSFYVLHNIIQRISCLNILLDNYLLNRNADFEDDVFIGNL